MTTRPSRVDRDRDDQPVVAVDPDRDDETVRVDRDDDDQPVVAVDPDRDDESVGSTVTATISQWSRSTAIVTTRRVPGRP